jgi:hypothetical protein
MIRHYLNFISPGQGRWEIEEPTNFDAIDFGIKQDDDRLGRDVSFAGASNKITANNLPNHCIEKLQYSILKKGFEAVVKYEIEFDETTYIIGDVDFASCTTDQNTEFTFSVLEENERAILKRKMDANVDLFSYFNIKGELTIPVNTYNMLLKAKPVFGISKWSNIQGGGQSVSLAGLGGTGNNITRNFSFANVNTQYDIKDSLSFIQGEGDANDFVYIEAEDNIKNVTVNITNLSYTAQGTNAGGLGGSGSVSLRWFVGTDDQLENTVGGNVLELDTLADNEGVEYNNASYTFTIPVINRGQRLYIWFRTRAQSETNDSTWGLVTTVNSMDIKITGTSTAYNTVTPVVRLIDAIKQVVKSISGLNVVAPRWELGGEFYDQYISTSNLLRALTDKPFYWSFKDIIQDYFPEAHADYQIRKNGDVFIGTYADFYPNYEIATSEQTTDHTTGQIKGFELSFNPRLQLGLVNCGFSTYQSLKETETENTNDEVHGELQAILPNEKVNNTKDIKIGVIRSAFSIAEAQKKAYTTPPNTATQDDNKIFIIDCLNFNGSQTFTETSLLKRQSIGGNLILTNDQSFNWEILGIIAGKPFTINSVNGEASIITGLYTVLEVTGTTLTLQPITAGIDTADPISITYTYYITDTSVDVYNRTNEGFGLISGVNEPNNFSNLVYTTKRVLKRYNAVMSSATMWQRDKDVNIGLYRNNGFLQTRMTGEPTVTQENGSFQLSHSDMILTPLLYKLFLRMSLREYLDLEENLRLYNGYIRTFDGNGVPIKGYLKSGTFSIDGKGHDDIDDLMGILECSLEERYYPDVMHIQDLGDGLILINNEILPSGARFSVDGYGKLSIFDANYKLLHVPVYYEKVKLNDNQFPQSTSELILWLSQIIAQE